jgi:outer membrane protein
VSRSAPLFAAETAPTAAPTAISQTFARRVRGAVGAMLLSCAAAVQAAPFDLLQLYEQLLTNNPQLTGGGHAIERAEAQEDVALSRLLPQVNASGNLSWNRLNQTFTNIITNEQRVDQFEYQGSRAVVQASQALFDLPSYYQLKRRRSALQQAEEDLLALRMSLTSQLVDHYMSVLQANEDLLAVHSEQELTAADLKRMRRMAELQLIMDKDMYEAEAFEHSLHTRELEVRNRKAIALQQLRELAGVEVEEVATLTIDTLPPVPGDADHWVETGRTQHPVLRAVQFGVDAAGEDVKSARARHWPLLTLNLTETYADNGGYDNRQSEPYDIGTLSLQLNVPIYAGGGTDAGVREAIANRGIAETDRLAKMMEIDRKTRTAFLQAQTERSRIDSLAQEIAAREKARDAQQKSYEIGVVTVVDALEAKKNLLISRSEYATARYDYVRLLVALKLWAGALSQADIEQINSWLD